MRLTNEIARAAAAALLLLVAAGGIDPRVGGGAAAAPVPKDKEKPKDEELIVGRWKMVEFDVGGGEKVPLPDEWKKMEYVFEAGGTMSVVGPKQTTPMTYKLDPTAKPKAFDSTRPDMDATVFGVYELDGDTLKVCLCQKPGAPRPTELKGDLAAQTAVWVYQRVKEEKK